MGKETTTKEKLIKKRKKFVKNINNYIDIVKSVLIGSAILDLYMEQNNKSIRIFPSLNYYYYKLKPPYSPLA